MAKILPPLLEGSLPAFCLTYEENELGEMLVDEKMGKPHVIGANLNIPFSLGRAVSINEIAAIPVFFLVLVYSSRLVFFTKPFFVVNNTYLASVSL